MKVYISHGAPRSDDKNDVEWFVVRSPQKTEDQTASLLKAGRSVYALNTDLTPWHPVITKI